MIFYCCKVFESIEYVLEIRDAEIDDLCEILVDERLPADWLSADHKKKILDAFNKSRNETKEMAEAREAEIDDFCEIMIYETLLAATEIDDLCETKIDDRLPAGWLSADHKKKILAAFARSRNETKEMAEARDAEIDDFCQIIIDETLRAAAEIDDLCEIIIDEILLAEEIQKWEGLYEKVVSLNDGLWFSEACLYYTRLGKSLPQAFPEFLINKGYLFVNEYLPVLVYFLIAALLSYVILGVSYTLVVQKPETEKTSGYECGFETYEDARHKFNVRFYLLAILFILFDIETMFLIPWCVTLSLVNYIGYLVMMEFILELLLGFLYVWYVGGLDWE